MEYTVIFKIRCHNFILHFHHHLNKHFYIITIFFKKTIDTIWSTKAMDRRLFIYLLLCLTLSIFSISRCAMSCVCTFSDNFTPGAHKHWKQLHNNTQQPFYHHSHIIKGLLDKLGSEAEFMHSIITTNWPISLYCNVQSFWNWIGNNSFDKYSKKYAQTKKF